MTSRSKVSRLGSQCNIAFERNEHKGTSQWYGRETGAVNLTTRYHLALFT